MIVKAIRQGFFNGSLRRPGDLFSIPSEEAFSALWMEVVQLEQSDFEKDEDETVEPSRTKRRGR
jgi:hypothetical protein